MTLTEFLLTRIAEDEAVASAVIAGSSIAEVTEPIWTGDDPWPTEQAFAERFTVGRVLAECEAKRRIVEGWADPFGTWTAMEAEMAAREKRRILALLALPYADHPDYDEAWRP